MLREQIELMNMEVLEILQNLSDTEHLDLKLKEIKTRDKNIDLAIEINKEKVYVEEKYEVRPNQVQQIHKQAELYHNETFLLASNYITPNAKELLKEYRINYLDSGGNLYLKLEKGIIHIEGKYVQSPSELYKNRAFTKVGAKLIFTFLRRPNYVNLNYRSLSAISTCSLGSISKIIDHLKEEKFIITLPGKKLKLVQREELLNKWIEVLSKQLLPSMLIGTYNFSNKKKWYEINLKQKRGYKWGGEVAASILTQNLKPQEYTIYTSKKSGEVIRALKLIPDRNGELTVYKEFWNDGSIGINTDTVDPILIYSELIASSDSRNIEIANEIKTRIFNDDNF